MMLLPLTPFTLLCAILLCLPLAVIFTFTTPSSLEIKNYPQQPKPQNKNQTSAVSNSTKTAIVAEPVRPPIEDHEDDYTLFKLASRVDPRPKPAKKLAFLFLTTAPLPFAPLWELYFTRAHKNLYNIYLHADPGAPNHTASFRGVFSGRVIPSKPTRRHSPTLISAARRLLAHALLHDGSNSMFALLSPSCIPIRSFNCTHGVLTKSKKSFIEILKDEPGAYDRWAARGEDAMLPEVTYEDFRIGSQFWVLTRKHARLVVSDKRLWSKFKLPCLRQDTCYPEEHYFPTLLNTVDSPGCTPCTLTHVDWRGSHGGHPRMYGSGEVGPELIWALRSDRPRYGYDVDSEPGGSQSSHNSSSMRKRSGGGYDDPFLFARKFSPGSLQRLLDIADDVVFKD